MKIHLPQLVILLGLIALGLLIGRAFEATWAGGTGFDRQLPLLVSSENARVIHPKSSDLQPEDTVYPGEIILVGENGYAQLNISSALGHRTINFAAFQVYLFPRADLHLKSNTHRSFEAVLRQGVIQITPDRYRNIVIQAGDQEIEIKEPTKVGVFPDGTVINEPLDIE